MSGYGFGSRHAQAVPADLDRNGSGAPILEPSNAMGEVIRFDSFILVPSTRTLLLNNQSVDIGSRAFDILTLLASARGKLVTKAEILSAVWPLTTVDESNLRFQIACLRKALGDDRELIKTIPGRGYIFIGETETSKLSRLLQVNRELPPQPAPLHASDAVEQDRNEAGIGNARNLHGPDIVLIDDDDGVREALVDFLSSAGFSVEPYPDVQSYLNSPSRCTPKCMVLDIWMPGMTGLEFQADLRRANVQAPIIFISGHADVPMSVRAMKAGAAEFLTKPVRHEDLLAAVRTAVAGGA